MATKSKGWRIRSGKKKAEAYVSPVPSPPPSPLPPPREALTPDIMYSDLDENENEVYPDDPVDANGDDRMVDHYGFQYSTSEQSHH